jgi:hypothetical protein
VVIEHPGLERSLVLSSYQWHTLRLIPVDTLLARVIADFVLGNPGDAYKGDLLDIAAAIRNYEGQN